MKSPELLIISLLFILCKQVIGIQKEVRDIILDPINLNAKENKIVQHTELPMVTNEVSVTLRLTISSHDPDYACVFHKGGQEFVRTPAVWLNPKNSTPHVRFSANDNPSAGIDSVGDGLFLNQWYHLAYTLSEPEKRLDFYINGQWLGFQSIQNVQTEYIIFNDGPLFIGYDIFSNGITGQISKFRYYNWRLSAEEVAADFQGNNTPKSPTTSPTTSPLTTPPQIIPTSTTQTTQSQSTSMQSEKFNNIATMAGISIGVSLGSILLTIVSFYLIKSYKKKQNQNRHPGSDVRVVD